MAGATRWRRRLGRAGIAATALAVPIAVVAPAASAAPVMAAKAPAPVHRCFSGPGFFSLFPIIINDVCYTVTTTRSGDQIMTFSGHQYAPTVTHQPSVQGGLDCLILAPIPGATDPQDRADTQDSVLAIAASGAFYGACIAHRPVPHTS